MQFLWQPDIFICNIGPGNKPGQDAKWIDLLIDADGNGSAANTVFRKLSRSSHYSQLKKRQYDD